MFVVNELVWIVFIYFILFKSQITVWISFEVHVSRHQSIPLITAFKTAIILFSLRTFNRNDALSSIIMN